MLAATIERFTTAHAEASRALGRPPSEAELAAHMGVSRERVRQVAPSLNVFFTCGRIFDGHKRRQKHDGAVRAAYERLRSAGQPVVARALAAEAGVSTGSARQIARRQGLVLDDGNAERGKRMMDHEKRTDLRRAHAVLSERLGRLPMVLELAEHLEWNRGTVSTRLREEGLPYSDGRSLRKGHPRGAPRCVLTVSEAA